jgi:hypothetical protein
VWFEGQVGTVIRAFTKQIGPGSDHQFEKHFEKKHSLSRLIVFLSNSDGKIGCF